MQRDLFIWGPARPNDDLINLEITILVSSRYIWIKMFLLCLTDVDLSTAFFRSTDTLYGQLRVPTELSLMPNGHLEEI